MGTAVSKVSNCEHAVASLLHPREQRKNIPSIYHQFPVISLIFSNVCNVLSHVGFAGGRLTHLGRPGYATV